MRQLKLSASYSRQHGLQTRDTDEPQSRSRRCDDFPPVSEHLWRWFAWYTRRFLRRRLHAVRLDRDGYDPAREMTSPDEPLILYMNHPSWYDPLIAVLLATQFWPGRRHYGPIDAAMLQKYRFFRKLGFFGVEPGTPRGAAAFLKTSTAILSRPNTCLWITAEGEFADVRRRPVTLKPGLAHLARRLGRGFVIPLSLEYDFWTESTAEALIRFGRPIAIEGRGESADEWNRRLASRLEGEMDRLAARAVTRDPGHFQTLLSGGGGTSLVYDAWRWLRAKVRGREFHRCHLPEPPPPRNQLPDSRSPRP